MDQLERQAFGSVAADQIANRTRFKSKGFFKRIKKLTGINKTDIIKTAKRIGKEVVSNSAALAGEAITAYTGNPVLGASTKHAIEKGGHKAIDSGNVRRGLRAAGGTAKQIAKYFAIEAADSYINTHLSGDEKKYAEKALAGEYPSAKDLIYDYGKTKAEKFEQQFYQPVGGGRLVHVHKYGMGSPYVSMPYKKAMRPLVGGGSLAGLGVSEIKPMTNLMTLSPVASMYSPQMNPFVLDKSPQLSTKIGGSFLPSGRYGGSFEPSGGY